ncbi:hypothetical protein LINPERHAP1_LOCUS34340, partial [Linum perenne]
VLTLFSLFQIRILTVAGFTLTIFSFYSITSYVLKQWSGATLLNLRVLTSDMWAVIIRIFFYLLLVTLP